jgi:hypothetical protein
MAYAQVINPQTHNLSYFSFLFTSANEKIVVATKRLINSVRQIADLNDLEGLLYQSFAPLWAGEQNTIFRDSSNYS